MGQPVDSESSSRSAIQRTGWTILLATFSGPDHQQEAARYRDQVSSAGLSDAWVEPVASGTAVFYGQYPAVDDARAQEDLAAIKGMTLNGRRAFQASYLTRIPGDASASGLHAFDLRTVRQTWRTTRALYSLQIAAFESEVGRDDRQRMDAAEQYAARLRAEGEEAYFYHGDRFSTVTVGVFGEDAIDMEAGGLLAPEVMALREKYPHNIYNGREIVTKKHLPSGQVRESIQPSFLVLVP